MGHRYGENTTGLRPHQLRISSCVCVDAAVFDQGVMRAIMMVGVDDVRQARLTASSVMTTCPRCIELDGEEQSGEEQSDEEQSDDEQPDDEQSDDEQSDDELRELAGQCMSGVTNGIL